MEEILIKQDINLLEHPLWFQNTKLAQREEGYVWKDVEGYTYRSGYKTPTKTDYVFLLCILDRCQKSQWKCKLEFSRYEILSDSGVGKDKRWYQRLEDSLKRWRYTGLEFKGTFYNGNEYETLEFGIIDYWGLNRDTKKIELHLNEAWILKIKNSEYYKLINFDTVKKLRSPVVIRLYEIILKNFQGRLTWKIDAVKLALKIPLQKWYPSQIVQIIGPAVKRIRKETSLKVYLELDKKERGKIILIFRLKDNDEQNGLPEPSSAKTKGTYHPELKELFALMPLQHVKQVEKIVSIIFKEKGHEYVKQAILYTNSQNPDNYPAYFTETLKKGYAIDYDSNQKKYITFKKEALKCFNNCNGSCASDWKRYKDNQNHNCFWCKKFEKTKTSYSQDLT